MWRKECLRWEFKSADLDEFKEHSALLMREIGESLEEVEELNIIISNRLCKVAEGIIGKGKIISKEEFSPLVE